MYFNKLHHHRNFRYATNVAGDQLSHDNKSFSFRVDDWSDSILRLTLDGDWEHHHSRTRFFRPELPAPSECQARFDQKGHFSLQHSDGTQLLTGHPDGSFGSCGSSWILNLTYDTGYRFYGCGEKLGPLEKTGYRGKFWNTDVFADFHRRAIEQCETDPMYLSIPYFIIRKDKHWIGVLVNNPSTPFLSLGGLVQKIANQMDIDSSREFYLGANSGSPEIWFIVDDSLAALTRKFQRLVGVTPLPPLWALGHHQCRWGYGDFDDLRYIAKQMELHEIPNSGLWLDIDYMDAYRVFTWSLKNQLESPADAVASLQADGTKVVPIVDPGVKRDPNFNVFQRGSSKDTWCLTPDGIPYVGYVWPGETVFPDFASKDARNWWSEEVAQFARCGIESVWIDMNDPSTGPAEFSSMTFDKGRIAHEHFHSQYAHGMAEATRDGLLAAHPDKRPFLISRSGWTGIQNYCGVWTGDNVSSDHYLAGCIPCSLNLALSGIPLNAPDVPGFEYDSSERLAARWYQLCFLFPFLRNHCAANFRGQEPWTFSRPIRENIAHLIRLRYRFLPYLYNLWIEQEQSGDAVLRPLFYDFPEEVEIYAAVTDQFLVGPALMQSPALDSHEFTKREIHLPNAGWLELGTGQWHTGNARIKRELGIADTALFARAGAVIPLLPFEPTHHKISLDTIDFHCFLREGDLTNYHYRADDGETFAYQSGQRSELVIEGTAKDETLDITVTQTSNGWKPIKARFVLYGTIKYIRVNGKSLSTEPFTWRATGEALNLVRSDELAFDEPNPAGYNHSTEEQTECAL